MPNRTRVSIAEMSLLDFKPTANLLELLNNAPDDLTLRHACNESWFTNQLAWLLDPKASHGLGVSFIQEFLVVVARKRSDENSGLNNKSTFLKFGKNKSIKGTHPSNLNVGNCATFSEFYLALKNKRKPDSGLYCDVVAIDLDKKDGLFLAVENKLFGHDRAGQLKSYYEKIEEKFFGTKVQNSKVREYVYLTLFNEPPHAIKMRPIWVPLGWTTDIYQILSKCLKNHEQKKVHSAVRELFSVLLWIRKASEIDHDLQSEMKVIKENLFITAIKSLFKELQRLEKKGSWELSIKRNTYSFKHSSYKSSLTIKLLPGLSIAITERNNKFEKILIPFGGQPEQVFNLIEIAAHDLYKRIMGDKATDYRNRKQANPDLRESELIDFVKFIYQHKHALYFFILGIQSINNRV